MPVFVLECPKCKTVIETGIKCTYEKAKETNCEKCDVIMIIVPQSCGSKINGYSYANGYHRDELSYDGRHPG